MSKEFKPYYSLYKYSDTGLTDYQVVLVECETTSMWFNSDRKGKKDLLLGKFENKIDANIALAELKSIEDDYIVKVRAKKYSIKLDIPVFINWIDNPMTGECPILNGIQVFLLFKAGHICKTCNPKFYHWNNTNGDSTIIKYAIVKE